jgi:hypothetical protein
MPLRISPDASPLPPGPRLFLAGSIEQGRAMPWQGAVATHVLAERPEVVVVNPRRVDWDPTWPQDPAFAPFAEQVNWELDHLLQADAALFVFDGATRSPVTLLELGLALQAFPDRLTLVCPRAFWRYGNIVLTAARFGVQVFETLDAGLADVLAHRLPPKDATP